MAALPLVPVIVGAEGRALIPPPNPPLPPVWPCVPMLRQGEPVAASTSSILQAVIHARTDRDPLENVPPGMEELHEIAMREMEQLRIYDQAIQIIGRRYTHLRFESVQLGTDALKIIFGRLANHYAFSCGKITWDGIACVVIMMAQMILEFKQGGAQPATYEDIRGWCELYFSTVTHHGTGNMTVNEWINDQSIEEYTSWMVIVYEARKQRDNLMPPIPLPNQAHPDQCGNCGHEREPTRFSTKRKPFGQCPFCRTFWCSIMKCKFVFAHPTDLLLHQMEYHRYPDKRALGKCRSCNNPQLHRTNYQSDYEQCKTAGCPSFFCVTDNCNSMQSSRNNLTDHLSKSHAYSNCGECKRGVKRRAANTTHDTCPYCGILWCLKGRCGKEYNKPHFLALHMNECDFGA